MTTSADLRIFFAFLIVSTTSFLPYNLFMNAHEYFYYKLRNLTGEENVTLQEPNKNEHEHTHLQHVFEGYVAFSSGIFCILGTLLNVLGTNRVSNSIRVIGGHAMVLIALVPTFVLVFVNTDEMQVSFFWLTMALAAVSAFGSMGLIGGGIMGLAATFPELCMRAVLIGQALAGVVSAVLSIACQMFASNDLSNGRAYFAIALGWTVVSVLTYIYLVKSPHSAEMQFRALSASDRRPLIPETLDDPPLHPAQVDSLLVDAPENFMTACRTVLRQASIELMSGFLVLFVTLSAFPSVASLITTESMNEKWQDYFSAIYCFLVFNVGDAGGRLVGSHLKLRREILLCACLLRVIFPVLLCLCNVSPRLHPELVLIPHDGLFLLLMVLFSISNGALLTASGIAVAQSVPEEMREVAGSTFALVAATASFLGSLVGVLLVAIL